MGEQVKGLSVIRFNRFRTLARLLRSIFETQNNSYALMISINKTKKCARETKPFTHSPYNLLTWPLKPIDKRF